MQDTLTAAYNTVAIAGALYLGIALALHLAHCWRRCRPATAQPTEAAPTPVPSAPTPEAPSPAVATAIAVASDDDWEETPEERERIRRRANSWDRAVAENRLKFAVHTTQRGPRESAQPIGSIAAQVA